MMLRFFIVLCALISPSAFSLFGQEVPTKVSEIYKMEDFRNVELLGRYADKIILSLNHEDRKRLMVFNTNLRLQKEAPIRYHFRKRPQDLFIYRDTIYHLYVKKNGLHAFIECERMDLDLKPIDTSTIYSEPYRFAFDYYYGFTEDTSPNYCFFREDHGNTIKILRFSKIDLKAIDTTLIEIKNYEPNQMSFHGAMDDYGDTYFAINKNNNSIKKSSSQWQVFKMGAHDERVYQIKMDDRLSTSAVIEYDELQDVLFIGGYYGTKSEELSSGSYRIIIDFENGDWRVDEEEFDKETVLEMTGKRRFTKRIIPSLRAKEVILRQDGGVLLLGEHEKIMNQINSLSPTAVDLAPRQTYFLEHALLSSFDPQFKSEWNQIIFKRQHSQNDDAKYSSFLSLYSTSELCIIVNDEVSNRNTMSKYEIQPSGRVMRRHFVPKGIEYPNIAFRNGVQFDHDLFYVIEYPKPNRFRLMEIGF